MFKFPLDTDDTYLILAPRWADLGAPWQVGLLSLLLLVPLMLILVLGRYELRLISRLAACGLMLIRFLILLVLWIAIGVQPQMAEFKVSETRGRVRIAVDLSSSMDVADRQRKPQERDALTRALKRNNVDALTRKQIIERILAPDAMNLLQRLADLHDVEVVAFDEQFHKREPAHLLQLLADKKSKPDIRATDMKPPLAEPPLLGVILFSDGRHNVGAVPDKQSVPIFPVVIGSRETPNDLMILGGSKKYQAFRGTAVPVKIDCKVTNLPAQELTVELQINGKPALSEHRQIIAHNGQDDVYAVTFTVKSDELGTHKLQITTKSDGQEITLANNHATHYLRIADDRAKVLLVDGEQRWEYHYLANALLRDPQIALDRVVFDQPRIGALKGDEFEKAGLAKSKLPEPKEDRKDHDPLLDYDCIILGDVSPEHVPLADRKRLEKFVSERGGTLILAAGKRHLPLAFKEPGDPIAKMLPIIEPRELKTVLGFSLKTTTEGKLRPFLRLDPESPANNWPGLPNHYWGVVGKRRPAASILMAPQLDPAEQPAKEDPDSGIIVQQYYGTGRVVFIGFDSTWRWRAAKKLRSPNGPPDDFHYPGEAYHHRFWGQLARWSAAEKMLPAGNKWVRYGTREPVYLEGDEIELAVRLSELLPPVKDLSMARAKLYREGADGKETLAATVPLIRDISQPNHLTAKVREVPGAYRVELDIPPYQTQIAEPSEDKDAVKGRDSFRVLPREQPEFLDLSTNWDLMQDLAEKSDGRLYTPETIEGIIERLAQRIERTEERTVSKPWQDEPMVWWLLGVLLGLLTIEWAWRKFLDLA